MTKRDRDLAMRVKDLRHLLNRIDQVAEEGQSGHFSYAMDRLRLIRDLVEKGHAKLERLEVPRG